VTTPLIKLASVLKLQLKFHLLHGFVPAQYWFRNCFLPAKEASSVRMGMHGGTSPQYRFCKHCVSLGWPLCSAICFVKYDSSDMRAGGLQQCTGEIAGGRGAAHATAAHLTARPPPAMPPNVTHGEPRP